jgi:hypothetical protein
MLAPVYWSVSSAGCSSPVSVPKTAQAWVARIAQIASGFNVSTEENGRDGRNPPATRTDLEAATHTEGHPRGTNSVHFICISEELLRFHQC